MDNQKQKAIAEIMTINKVGVETAGKILEKYRQELERQFLYGDSSDIAPKGLVRYQNET